MEREGERDGEGWGWGWGVGGWASPYGRLAVAQKPPPPPPPPPSRPAATAPGLGARLKSSAIPLFTHSSRPASSPCRTAIADQSLAVTKSINWAVAKTVGPSARRGLGQWRRSALAAAASESGRQRLVTGALASLAAQSQPLTHAA